MTSSDPDVIRRQIEDTRANLSYEVDALNEKVNPTRVVDRRVGKAKSSVAGLQDKVFGAAQQGGSQVGGKAHDVAGSGQMPRGFQRDLIERIMPSVLETQRHGHQDVNSAVVEHTKQTASRLMEQSRVIADAVSNGDVAVVGVFYHLEDGEAELVHGHGTWLPGR